MAGSRSSLGNSPMNTKGYGNTLIEGRTKPQMIGAPGSLGTALALKIRSEKGWGK